MRLAIRGSLLVAVAMLLMGMPARALPANGAKAAPSGGSGVEALLARIPEAMMPPGGMTDAAEKAFRKWAASQLPGEPVLARFVVSSVGRTADGATVVTGLLPVSTPVHGRIALCRVRVVLAKGAEGAELPDLQPGTRVTLSAEAAASEPLCPTRGKVALDGAEQTITGWTADRACFAVNLEHGRAPAPDDALQDPEAEAASGGPRPVPAGPASGAQAAAPAKAPTPASPPAEKKGPEKPKVPPAAFFKVSAGDADRIVYVVDRSGSMTDSIDYVRLELKRSIRELAADKEFAVFFYSSGPPVVLPLVKRSRKIVAGGTTGRPTVTEVASLPKATDANKAATEHFIDGVIPQGETDPSQALRQAFDLKPGVIFLLTDGEFDHETIGLVKRLNADGKVRVHTIGFLYRTGEPVLKEIAGQNGGEYRFVAESDLPHLNEDARTKP